MKPSSAPHREELQQLQAEYPDIYHGSADFVSILKETQVDIEPDPQFVQNLQQKFSQNLEENTVTKKTWFQKSDFFTTPWFRALTFVGALGIAAFISWPLIQNTPLQQNTNALESVIQKTEDSFTQFPKKMGNIKDIKKQGFGEIVMQQNADMSSLQTRTVETPKTASEAAPSPQASTLPVAQDAPIMAAEPLIGAVTSSDSGAISSEAIIGKDYTYKWEGKIPDIPQDIPVYKRVALPSPSYTLVDSILGKKTVAFDSLAFRYNQGLYHFDATHGTFSYTHETENRDRAVNMESHTSISSTQERRVASQDDLLPIIQGFLQEHDLSASSYGNLEIFSNAMPPNICQQGGKELCIETKTSFTEVILPPRVENVSFFDIWANRPLAALRMTIDTEKKRVLSADGWYRFEWERSLYPTVSRKNIEIMWQKGGLYAEKYWGEKQTLDPIILNNVKLIYFEYVSPSGNNSLYVPALLFTGKNTNLDDQNQNTKIIVPVAQTDISSKADQGTKPNPEIPMGQTLQNEIFEGKKE